MSTRDERPDPITWLMKNQARAGVAWAQRSLGLEPHPPTPTHQKLIDQGERRRWQAASQPAFWREIAEMQRRLGWPAGGVSRQELEGWSDELQASWLLSGLVIAEPIPYFAEVQRVCQAAPPLHQMPDWPFVLFIAYMGLDVALNSLTELVEGNPSARHYRVEYRGGVPIQVVNEFDAPPRPGKRPLDPRIAVTVFKASQEAGVTLVEIGRFMKWPCDPNEWGGEHCPLAAHYRDHGREIIDAYAAETRPALRVPTLEDCLEYGWLRRRPNC